MEGRDVVGAGGNTVPSNFLNQRGVGTSAGSSLSLHAPTPLRTPSPTTTNMTLSSPNAVSDASGPQLPLSINVGGQTGSYAGGLTTGISRSEPPKRKRGRPRKYPDGVGITSMALALTPLASKGPQSPIEKRGRGRPPGSGKKQQLAALGTLLAGSAGAGFTPHVITIAAGEDVAHKVLGFSQQGPRAVCVLSANGSISNVTLRHDSSFGGSITYEGRYEILSLTGSFLPSDLGGARSRTGGLSVSLAANDGKVVGGSVSGLLVAATPVQIVVGSFVPQSGGKPRTPPQSGIETGNGEQSVGLMTSIGLAPSIGYGNSGVATSIPSIRPVKDEVPGATKPGTSSSFGPSSGSSLNHQSGGAVASIPSPVQGLFQSSSQTWHSQQVDGGRRSSTDINITLPAG